MNNIMIDLETLGDTPTAAIISIGARKFDPETGIVGDGFYAPIDWKSSLRFGDVTASTLKWWLQQSEQARLDACDGNIDLFDALSSLRVWMGEDPIVWGNGATFDITIIEHAFRRQAMNIPWSFRNVRDMRTIAALKAVGKNKILRTGTAHNALDDATWQAQFVALAMKRISLGLEMLDSIDNKPKTSETANDPKNPH